MRSLFLLGALLAAQELVRADVTARRADIRKALPECVTVLFGRNESGDLHDAFFQESNFYYLTGWAEPGAILMLAPDGDTLFLPRRNLTHERWTGAKAGPEDPSVQRATGIGKVLPVERFESELRASLEKHLGVCALTEDKEAAARLEKLAPLRQIQNAQRAIAHRRMKKEPEEIAAIQRSIDATVAAHLAGWKRAAPGVAEYQVAAAMIAVYLDKGCERSAYAPIVGSGPNSTILHYSRNSRVMDKGETLVVDVGAECAGYAADVTRTIPVGGRFSPRQREIYDVVLGAQKAVIAAIRPGVLIGSRGGKDTLYRVAYDYINTHGKDLHGEPLGQYFIHGISHNVGLDVHDAEDLSLPLAAGMVITVEPGVYIPEENIGVRIEDTVLVTEDGCKVMSAALPKEAAEIEKILKK